jgi:signal transduction histidine kinase
MRLDAVFRLPPQPDAEQDRAARLLRGLTWLTIAWFVALLVASALVEPASGPRALTAGLIVVGLSITSLVLLQRGRLRAASTLYVVQLWLAVTVSAITGGGLATPAVQGYLLVILAAGLLIGWNWGLVSGGVCLASQLAIAYAELRGWLPAFQGERTPLTYLIVYSLLSGVVVIFVYYFASSIRTALTLAQREVGERKRAEEIIRLQSARVKLLANVSQAFSEAGLDDEAVLTTVARRTAELIGDACVVTLFSDDRQRAFPVAFHHPDPQALALMRDALVRTWQGGTDTDRFRSLIAGEAVYLPVVEEPAYRAATEPEFWPFVDQFGIASVLIEPLQAHGEVIGSLGLTRDRTGQPYTPDDQRLLREVAGRAALSIQNARLFQSVDQHRQRLRALSSQLVEAQEAERRFLARELHDEFGQVLTGLRMTLQESRQHATPGPAASLERAQAQVGRLMDQVQTLSLDLRPTLLDDLGLAPALGAHLERFSLQTGVRVHFHASGSNRRFAPQVETAAFRIVQEALTNIARHAGVQEGTVHVRADPGSLVVQIDDAGTGFDARTALADPQSSGLRNMRERAELLGADLTIESAPGAGTQITAEFVVHDVSGAQVDGHHHSVSG